MYKYTYTYILIILVKFGRSEAWKRSPIQVFCEAEHDEF